ncbi:5076_t:CDS:2, partial [Cetraspora pellucida]
TDKSYKKDNNSSGLGMTKTEIENLIKSMMPSIQEIKTQHFVSSQLISSQPSQSYYRPQPPGTSQIIQDTNMTRLIQWLTGEIPEFVPVSKPDLPLKPTIKKALQSNNPQGLEVTDNDPVEDMSMKKNSSKPKSSNRKTKTKSRTKKSSRSKHVNAHIISDESSSDSSDSENKSDFSETSESSNSENDESETRGYASSEEYEVNAIKKKITFSDSKRSKKHK